MILQAVATGRTITESLGVDKEREQELLDIVLEEINRIDDSGGAAPLSQYYQRIACECRNLEEYTVCMHTFLFAITKNGVLSTDKTISN